MATRNNKFPVKSNAAAQRNAKPAASAPLTDDNFVEQFHADVERRGLKPTVVDEPTVAQTVATPEPNFTESASALFERMLNAIDDYAEAVGAPSRNRAILSWFTGTFAGMLVGYGLGSLLSYAVIGALLMTGSAFLATMIYVLGMIAGCYAAVTAGRWVTNYIVTKEIDADYARVKLAAAGPIGFVKSFFVTKVGVA